MERRPSVKIFGEEYNLRAQVETINGFSAHADRTELQDYVRQLGPGGLKSTFVVHGEEAASLALADGLQSLGATHAVVPRPGEEFEI